MGIRIPEEAALTPLTGRVVRHELAHGANGDASRSFFVATAIRSLVVWYRLLRPAQLYRRRYRGLEAIAEVIANVAMLGLAQIVRGLASALVHLLWRNKQRAEYLADALGAQVSGTAAMLSQLDKLHLSGIYGLVVRRYALGGGNSAFFDMLQAEVAQVPERERERIRQVARLHGSRLDATHPPTPLRIDMLREHLVTTPLVVLSAEDNARIDAELAGLRARTQHEIADAQSARLYY